jgi:hypothetical protein
LELVEKRGQRGNRTLTAEPGRREGESVGGAFRSHAEGEPTDGRNVAPRESLTFILFSCRRYDH